jgi:hypothetical protein
LILFPAVAFILLIFVISCYRPSSGYRSAFLRAALLWSAICVLITELTSIFRILTATALVTAWGLICLCLAILLFLLRVRGVRPPTLEFRKPKGILSLVLGIGVLLIVAATFTAAFFSPPNGYEVLHYHLSRVAHWAQNQSIAPFTTGVEIQNSQAPMAEFMALHLFLLAQGDRFVHCIQWFAMVTSILAVSLISVELGARERVQLVAVGFAATLPVGISQATNAENDYVMAWFVLAAVLEVLPLLRSKISVESIVFSSLAAGLAILTKPTALIFLLPFALVAGIQIIRQKPRSRIIPYLAISLAIVSLVNLGHISRNYRLYGDYSEPSMIEDHLNRQRDLRGLASNVMRHAALHAGTPWEGVNRWIYVSLLKVHVKMGQDLNDPDTTAHTEFLIREPRFDETDGNPLHALLIVLTTASMLIACRKQRRDLWIYSILALSTFILFAFLNKWQIFGNRYHLSFFLLFAPVFAIALSNTLPSSISNVVSILLVLYAIPWTTELKSRPLLPSENRASIFKTSREHQLFLQTVDIEEPYRAVSDVIKSRECKSVGIMISGGWPAAEYPIWVLLEAPWSGIRIEWIVSGTPSSHLSPIDFQPCAIICDQTCPSDWKEVKGLPFLIQSGDVRLYAQ